MKRRMTGCKQAFIGIISRILALDCGVYGLATLAPITENQMQKWKMTWKQCVSRGFVLVAAPAAQVAG